MFSSNKYKLLMLLKNIGLVLSSNFLNLLISVFVIILFPKFIGVSDYAYLQLYIFYISYVGVFHLGWLDGIYLKLGGKYYSELEQKYLLSQLIQLLIFQVLISCFLYFLSELLLSEVIKKSIVFYSLLGMIILNLRGNILCLFQATNRMKEYSLIIIFEKLFYIVSLLLLAFWIYSGGSGGFKELIYVDIFSKLLSLGLAIYFFQSTISWNKLFFIEVISSIRDIKDSIDNIRVGYNLLLANLSSLLIIGIIRFFIEYKWGTIEFGKISLILSLSNFALVFINAISVAIYPLLRRVGNYNLSEIYILLRNIFLPFLSSVFIFFGLFYSLLKSWLPEYSESLSYLFILFPIFFFEGKNSLLIFTYLKVIRKEKLILKLNLIILLLSIAFVIALAVLDANLEMLVNIILLLIFMKSFIAELVLYRLLKLEVNKSFFIDLFIVFSFILSQGLNNDFIKTLFIVEVIIYILLNINRVHKSIIRLMQYSRG